MTKYVARSDGITCFILKCFFVLVGCKYCKGTIYQIKIEGNLLSILCTLGAALQWLPSLLFCWNIVPSYLNNQNWNQILENDCAGLNVRIVNTTVK